MKLSPDGTREQFQRRCDPGIDIPDGAARIHGIRTDDVRGLFGEPPLAKIAPEFLEFIGDADLTGFNCIGYDLPLMVNEFKRHDVAFDVEGRSIVDAKVIFDRKETGWDRFLQGPRNLNNAVLHYCGRDQAAAFAKRDDDDDGAVAASVDEQNRHSAVLDADATLDVLLAQLERHDDLPRDVKALHEYCASRDAARDVGRAAGLSAGVESGLALHRSTRPIAMSFAGMARIPGMRLTQTFIVCAVAAVVAPSVVAQDPVETRLPERALDVESTRLLEAAMGRHAFDAFRAFARGEEDETVENWNGTGRLGAAALAGLWSDDREVALGALYFLEEATVGVDDIERYHRFADPIVLDGEPASSRLIEFDFFKRTISNVRLEALLRHGRPRWDGDFRYFLISNLHRSLRPEHMPALAELTRSKDPFIRKQAVDYLILVAATSDQHRSAVARVLLEYTGSMVGQDAVDRKSAPEYEPREYRLEEKGGGLSAELAAALRVVFLGEHGDALLEIYSTSSWLLRWVGDSSADASDVPLLLELLGSTRKGAREVATVGLRGLASEGVVAAQLESIEKDSSSTSSARAMANLLAVDPAALDALGPNPESKLSSEDVGLSVALEATPREAVREWIELVATADASGAQSQIDRMAGALENPVYMPLVVADETFDRIASTIEKRCDSFDAALLAKIVEALPFCRSEKLGQLLLERITPECLSTSCVAFLEVHDEPALRRRLAGLLESGDSTSVGKVLLKLGAPDHAEAVLAAYDADPERSPVVLARSAAAQTAQRVRARLDHDLRAASGPKDDWFVRLAAVAQAGGMEETLCAVWAATLDSLPEEVAAARFDGWRQRVLDGEGLDVMFESLAALPIRKLDSLPLGSLDDRRALDLLREVRDTPGARRQWAIGELAIAGDVEATNAMVTTMDRAYYSWHDDASPRILTRGAKIELAAYWFGELETNCCRSVAASQAIEGLFDVDVTGSGNYGLSTPRAYWERWFARVRSRMKWSRYAQRFVVGSR